MPCDPANIRCAKIYIILLDIKNPFESKIYIKQVACLGMQNSFRLSGCAACVKDEQRILRMHAFGLTNIAYAFFTDQIMPPKIPTFNNFDIVAGSFNHNQILDALAIFQGSISIVFKRENLSIPKAPVCSYEQFSFGILYPILQCI